jgi:hypothetical protein
MGFLCFKMASSAGTHNSGSGRGFTYLKHKIISESVLHLFMMIITYPAQMCFLFTFPFQYHVCPNYWQLNLYSDNSKSCTLYNIMKCLTSDVLSMILKTFFMFTDQPKVGANMQIITATPTISTQGLFIYYSMDLLLTASLFMLLTFSEFIK